MTVAIDFDKTLDRPEVQLYVKGLVDRGIDVWILTARFDELHKHLWTSWPDNSDLYEIADKVGIPKHKIIFTNLEHKWKYLNNTKVLFLLDDNEHELYLVNLLTGVKGISSLSEDWEEQCENVFFSLIG